MTRGGSEIVIIVPVLRRPHRAAPLVESVRSTSDARVLFVASPDDDAEQQAVAATGADILVLDQRPGCGDYARKINTAYRATSEPLMFLGADDLLFHAGWFGAAVAKLTAGVGVVGTNDLGNPRVIRGDHATHCLVRRSYVDEFGTIDRAGEVLFEGYYHEFVDDEFVGTAKHRGAWAFAADSIVEHLHPHWGKAPTDDLYDAQARRMKASRPLYQRRRPRWM
jgi:hypothetical protein